MLKKTVSHTQAWGGRLYRFDHVPAWVCARCGQVWLAAEVSQAMDEIIQKPPKTSRFLRVPVFSLSELTETF
ncbi:MAG: YgiT-type zinc finger protein [Acidobacteria bacterium]|nr:YgiT-type zinc finger protein [Acidobacteriota bacterium]